MPNLNKFSPAFRTFEGEQEPQRRKKEIVRLHRHIQVYGETALLALKEGDSDKFPAPTYVISPATYRQLQNVSWSDYDPVLCYPPNFAFYVRPAETVKILACESTNAKKSIEIELAGFFALTTGKGDWVISDLIKARDDALFRTVEVGTETIARLSTDTVWNPGDRENGIAAFSICGPNVVFDKVLPYVDCQKIARALVSFLYLINSSVIRCKERERLQAKNRTERRQQEREPPGLFYDLEVPEDLSVEALFERIHAGYSLGPRIAGAVRTELIHRAYPNVRYVSSTSRYDELERFLRPKAEDNESSTI